MSNKTEQAEKILRDSGAFDSAQVEALVMALKAVTQGGRE